MSTTGIKYDTPLGALIRQKAKESDLSLRAFAGRAGISHVALIKLAYGNRRTPNLQNAIALAPLLGCTIEELARICEMEGTPADDEDALAPAEMAEEAR